MLNKSSVGNPLSYTTAPLRLSGVRRGVVPQQAAGRGGVLFPRRAELRGGVGRGEAARAWDGVAEERGEVRLGGGHDS